MNESVQQKVQLNTSLFQCVMNVLREFNAGKLRLTLDVPSDESRFHVMHGEDAQDSNV